MDIICFHNPDEENGYLSNWYLSDFQVEGQFFSSMEQYMMYQKARVFGDEENAALILQSSNVATIKKLGRAVKNYHESIWSGRRQIIVYRGLMEKFRQNPALQEMLLATGNCILAECAVKDQIWGIGLGMKSKDRFDMDQWQGQNLLGYTLMEVRNVLRDNCTGES